ncbi:hypothetical protein [Streptomyces sp. NRRL F-5122]|nr:hypothetical protein [Streptomyces sp. NRRL F-5122]
MSETTAQSMRDLVEQIAASQRSNKEQMTRMEAKLDKILDRLKSNAA